VFLSSEGVVASLGAQLAGHDLPIFDRDDHVVLRSAEVLADVDPMTVSVEGCRRASEGWSERKELEETYEALVSFLNLSGSLTYP